MVETVLGKSIFQSALQSYIRTYQFSNADHEMLFEKFTEAAADTVRDWCGRPMNITHAIFSQQPYNDVTNLPPNNTFGYMWPIPFYWKNYRHYYKNNETSLKWLIPAYETCAKSATASYNRAIHWDMDKVHLIGDQLAIATERDRKGMPFSYHKVLDLITTILPKYPHYATFRIAQDFIDFLERLFMDGPDYELFKAGIRRWLEENYNILGYTTTGNWNNDMTRYLMLPYAVRYDVGTSAEEATEAYGHALIICTCPSLSSFSNMWPITWRWFGERSNLPVCFSTSKRLRR
uniref:Uncharacterized protein n=1 Tax=Parascaris equorum TaxID=6256 RepID=A0A914RPG1_PAREQ